MGSEPARAVAVGAATLVAAFALLTWQTMRLPAHAPARFIAELRLAQAGAVLLAFSAAFLAGLAAGTTGPVAGLDMALAVLLCGLSLMTLVWDARAALGWLAMAFFARTALDLLHLTGALPPVAPAALLQGSAVANLLAAFFCGLPLSRVPRR